MSTLITQIIQVAFQHVFWYVYNSCGDVIIAISQSGETADTLVALESAKEKGAFIFGIVNAVGSSIARLSNAGAYTHAGPEIGVASTKAFTGQLTVLAMIALKMANSKGSISDGIHAARAYMYEFNYVLILRTNTGNSSIRTLLVFLGLRIIGRNG